MKFQTFKRVVIIGFVSFAVLVFLVGELWLTKKEVKMQKAYIEELENHFQVYRSAAEDAYGFALGSLSEHGEKIPAEFFLRYAEDVKTEEESAALYAEARRIVGEREKRIMAWQNNREEKQGYSYRGLGY